MKLMVQDICLIKKILLQEQERLLMLNRGLSIYYLWELFSYLFLQLLLQMEESGFVKGAKKIYDCTVVNLPYLIRKNQRNGSLAQIVFQQYIVEQQIGHGKFAKVYSAKHKDTAEKYALKIIDYELIKKSNDVSKAQKIFQLINREQQLLKSVNSPFVLKFEKSYQNKNWKVYVLQYCNEGTLLNYLQDRNWCLQQKEAIGILKQICLGVYELYKKSIIHRDLKLENIMRGYGIFKIIDLGFSKQIVDTQQTDNHTMVGSPYTTAPEVTSYQRYGVKADIYSIGVIFLRLIVRNLEYNMRTPYNFKERTSTLKNYKNENLSEEIIDFLAKTLQKNQDLRIGWNNLLQHPIFNNHKHITESKIKSIVDQNFELLKMQVKVSNLHVFLVQQQQQQPFESQITVYFKAKKNAKLQNVILELKKSQYILVQIVNKLQNKNYKIINCKSKSHMKLMTLLTQRAYLNLNYVTRQLSTLFCEQNVKNYAFQLLRQSKQKFENYVQIYDGLKQSLFYKIKSIPNFIKSIFFNNKNDTLEQQIFNGEQNKNFMKEEQIQMTLDSIQHFIDIIYSRNIRKSLLAYQRIMKLQICQQLFDEEVNKILANSDKKYKK